MSIYRLDKLLSPRSIAVVGASPREKSAGRAVLSNLLRGGFAGPIQLVNPHYELIEGIKAAKSYDQLADAPDVAVIAAPPPIVPSIVAAAGAKGTAAAVILTAGLGRGPGSLADACEKSARATGMRLVGPNCLGMLLPHVKLNASLTASMPRPGDLAVVCQSGAIAADLVESAAARGVGFSAIVCIGDSIEVDLGDLLDFFAIDRATCVIALYVERVRDARKFMSAARAAGRAKPVLVVKSGRYAQAAKAASTHTGMLAGSDAVYEAAFRRAGLLRVLDIDELFAAAQTCRHLRKLSGKRLAIVTNGSAAGVLAADRLADLGGELAGLSPDTLKKLDAVLPPSCSRSNPVDIGTDADDVRYAAALEQLLVDDQNDAVLVMNVPTALASAAAAAQSVIAVTETCRKESVAAKPVLAVWIGSSASVSAAFEAAGVTRYAAAADAVSGFMHLVRYKQSRVLLMAAPPSLPQDFVADIGAVRAIVGAALRDKRSWLDPAEMTRVFSAYGIAITPATIAGDVDQAVAAARPHLAAGNAVVVKILSPDIVHKSEVGGVRLNLTSEKAVREATTEILSRARAAKRSARITGVTVSPMIVRPKARELIVGVADDPTFGPIIVFGQGGIAVEVINDKALALPPLDLDLAHQLIARTRVSRILKAYRNVPAADERAVELLIVKLAQLVADVAEIREIDLNPVLADETGVIAVDARVMIAPVEGLRRGPSGHPRFAIRPYPKEWERRVKLQDGTAILVRPVKPEDEPLYVPFFAAVTQEDLRLRFFAPVKDFSHAFIARFTQIDYARAMAFIAIEEATGRMLGVVRLHADSNFESGEYAILLRSDLKGRGLGWQLMQLIIEYGRDQGLHAIRGEVLRENTTMLEMCRNLGFSITSDLHDASLVNVTLPLERA
ncbi:MAG TPA: bifunctional acetate--CoA ligase family protein/GNAT family N-acetyltransferase [Xanthobacteraceae bacterium]